MKGGMVIKTVIVLLLMGISCCFSAWAVETPQDSLLLLMENTTDANKLCELNVHLADLLDDEEGESLKYWEKALKQATDANNEAVMVLAFKNLIICNYFVDNVRGGAIYQVGRRKTFCR